MGGRGRPGAAGKQWRRSRAHRPPAHAPAAPSAETGWGRPRSPQATGAGTHRVPTLAQVARRGRDVPAPPLSGASSLSVAAAPNSAPPTPTPLGPGRSPAAAPRSPRQRRPRAFVRPRREQRAPPDEGWPGWDRSLGVLLTLRSCPALPAPEETSAAGLTSPPASGLSRVAPLAPQAAARPSGPPSGRGPPARRAFASVGARGPGRCARTCRACALCPAL